jgi:hypothetical protein
MAAVFTSLGTNNNNSGATLAITGVTVPAGAHIVVFIYERNTSAVAGTVTDGVNAGNYTSDATLRANPNALTANGYAQIHYRRNSAALTGATLTYNKQASGRCVMSAAYITGVKDVAPTVSVNATGTGTTPSVASGVIPDVLTALLGGAAIAGAATADTFTITGNLTATPPFTDATNSGFARVRGGNLASTTTASKIFSATIATNPWAAFMVGWPVAPDVLGAGAFATAALGLGAPVFAQRYGMTAIGFAVPPPVLGGPTLLPTVKLTAVSVLATASPVIGTPALRQRHAVATPGLTVGHPAFAVPVLAKSTKAALAAVPVAAGQPVIGGPVMGRAAVFPGKTSLALGSPAMGSSAVGAVAAPEVVAVSPALASAADAPIGALALGDVTGFVVGDQIEPLPLIPASPALDSPALGQHHYITAISLAPTALAIGSPRVGGKQTLPSPLGFSVGSPVLGTPSTAPVQHLTAFDLSLGRPDIAPVAPVLTVTPKFTAIGFAVAPPVIDRPSLLLPYVAPIPLTVGPPTFTAPTLRQHHYMLAFDKVVAPPALGQPALARLVYGMTAIDVAVLPPALGTPAMKRVVGLSAQPLTVGSPVLGRPLEARFMYAMTAQSLAPTVGPVLGSPLVGTNPVFHPLSILIARPDLGGPTMTQVQRIRSANLTVHSPEFGGPPNLPPLPVFFAFDQNPEVICLVDRDDPTSMPSIHANYNAFFELECWPGPNLVGRTDPGRGPAQIIWAQPPLALAEQKLGLDLANPLVVEPDGSLAVEIKAPLVIDGDGSLVIDQDALLGKINEALFGISGAAATTTTTLGGIARDIAELKGRMDAVEKRASANSSQISFQKIEISDLQAQVSYTYQATVNWAASFPPGTNVDGTTDWSGVLAARAGAFGAYPTTRSLSIIPTYNVNFILGPPSFGVPVMKVGARVPNFTVASPEIGKPLMTTPLPKPLGVTVFPPSFQNPRCQVLHF